MLEQKYQFEDREYLKSTLRVVTGLCFVGTGLLGFQTLISGFSVLDHHWFVCWHAV